MTQLSFHIVLFEVSFEISFIFPSALTGFGKYKPNLDLDLK